MENSKNTYKILEFGILIFAIVLFIKYSGISLTNGTAGAFEWEKEVNIYFVDPLVTKIETDRNTCAMVKAVERKIPNAEILGPGVIDALLKGPTEREKRQGYDSAINKGTLLQKFEIKNRVAYVDFNQSFWEVADSCEAQTIRSQIKKTLTNLPNIDSVVISVNGQTEGI